MKKFSYNRLKHEQLLLNIIITIAFVTLIIIVMLLASTFIQYLESNLVLEIERDFNNIIFDFQQGNIDSTSVINTSNIIGIGIYSPNGEVQLSWGDVYSRIASYLLPQGENVTYTINVNTTKNIIEYVRYLERPLVTPKDPSNLIDTSSLFSTIMYISFTSVDFLSSRNAILLAQIISIIALVIVYLYIIKVGRENKRIKDRMQKQENLVNLGQAARTLTHEIKNPLSAIKLQTALLKKQLAVTDFANDLELIESETSRLTALTNKVSDFLKNPEGKPEEIDLVELIKNLISLFSVEIKILPSSVEHAIVNFDIQRLRSVIENVLKNAVESSETRDPNVEVEILLVKKNLYKLYVRDRGDGIKRSHMDKLFDPFFTTKIRGSGIGLSISKQFLNARNSDIKLSQRKGGGTVVEITMPKYYRLKDLASALPSKKDRL